MAPALPWPDALFSQALAISACVFFGCWKVLASWFTWDAETWKMVLLEQLGYSLERCSGDAGHWSWKFSALAGQFSLSQVTWRFRPDTVS